MRVVSWNLQHGVPDPVGPPDLERAIDALQALAGDVHALQELDRARLRTRFTHQAAVLADRLGGALVWARAKHWLWASQGNALVVRGEVVDQEILILPGSGERRVALLASLLVDGRRWSLATTHLSLDNGVARRQLLATLRSLSARPRPRVLVGDLNLESVAVSAVADVLGYALVDGPPSVDARRTPTRRLDHILVQGATVVASGVAKLPVSDHLAVWVDLG